MNQLIPHYTNSYCFFQDNYATLNSLFTQSQNNTQYTDFINAIKEEIANLTNRIYRADIANFETVKTQLYTCTLAINFITNGIKQLNSKYTQLTANQRALLKEMQQLKNQITTIRLYMNV